MGGDDLHGLGVAGLILLFLPLGLPGIATIAIGSIIGSETVINIGYNIFFVYAVSAMILESVRIIYLIFYRHKNHKEQTTHKHNENH